MKTTPTDIRCSALSCIYNDSRNEKCMSLHGTAYAPGDCPFYKEHALDKSRSCSWMQRRPDDHIGYWGRRHGEL